MSRVLLADSEKEFRHPLAEALRNARYAVSECESADEARAQLLRESWDVVLIDLGTPGIRGLEFIQETRNRLPLVPIVVLTSEGSIEGAVQAVRLGAQEYLPKPVPVDLILKKIAGLHLSPVPHEIGNPAPNTFADGVPTGLAGTSRAMRDLHRLLFKVAPSNSTVLITGETGTGKDLVARAIHQASPRRDRPFIAVNCSAIPETLLESQLFGHLRGAFTGADRNRLGLLEAAGQGTLFLDEIGELPLSLQPKLLRAIDAREYLPLGSTEIRPFAARLLGATNRNLKAMVESGRFRQDLYFRLTTFEIPIPPLRERPEDVSVTAQNLLTKIAETRKRSVPQLSPAALTALEQYQWPGNVRELANFLERALILNEGTIIEAEDLPKQVIPIPLAPGSPLRDARKAFERHYVHRILDSCGGDKAQAAKALGIALSSLYRHLGIESSSQPNPERTGVS